MMEGCNNFIEAEQIFNVFTHDRHKYPANCI